MAILTLRAALPINIALLASTADTVPHILFVFKAVSPGPPKLLIVNYCYSVGASMGATVLSPCDASYDMIIVGARACTCTSSYLPRTRHPGARKYSRYTSYRPSTAARSNLVDIAIAIY